MSVAIAASSTPQGLEAAPANSNTPAELQSPAQEAPAANGLTPDSDAAGSPDSKQDPPARADCTDCSQGCESSLACQQLNGGGFGACAMTCGGYCHCCPGSGGDAYDPPAPCPTELPELGTACGDDELYCDYSLSCGIQNWIAVQCCGGTWQTSIPEGDADCSEAVAMSDGGARAAANAGPGGDPYQPRRVRLGWKRDELTFARQHVPPHGMHAPRVA
jgi:hypothetical protein